MSVIKEGGPYVVALAGMAAGYFGGRRTGRESRHHARVEALYQDMLDDLSCQSRRVHRVLGVDEFGVGPPGPEVQPVSESRVRLSASPPVSEAWGGALFALHALELLGDDDSGDRATDLLFRYRTAEDAMLAAMRDDLGVPKGPIWRRLRRRAMAPYWSVKVRWRGRKMRREGAAQLRP
ncbi:hypothetical protein ACI2LF_22815 [Kribbella sp. NPDC020789]